MVHVDGSGTHLKQNLSNFKQPTLSSKQILNIYKQSQGKHANDEDLVQKKRVKQVRLSDVSEEQVRREISENNLYYKNTGADTSPISDNRRMSGYSGS